MAFRRQELTRRRKAVGFTQESLAEHLGVERSTVIRWEAGDSEPLPSIRPNLARALQVSIDQLAELLITSTDESATGPLSADPDEATPAPSGEGEPPSRSELVDLIDPQVAEAVEALRRALRTAGVNAEDLAAMLLVGGSSQVLPSVAGPEVQIRRARSRRHKWLAATALFVLALPAVWLSAPFMLPAGQESAAAPLSANPSANPAGRGAGNGSLWADSAGAIPLPPAVAPISEPAAPAAAAMPASPSPGVTGNSRIAGRSTSQTHSWRYPPRFSPEPVLPATFAGDRWHRLNQIEGVYHLW